MCTSFKIEIVSEEIDCDGEATVTCEMIVNGKKCGRLKMLHHEYKKFIIILKRGAAAFSYYYTSVKAAKPRMEIE